MSAAIFGLVGVVVGAMLSALLNYLLQKTQDRRRWEREDALKFEPERLALYRDFLNDMEGDHTQKTFERQRLSRILSEMELLSSKAVFERAHEAFTFAEFFLNELSEDSGRFNNQDFEEMKEHLDELTYRFNRAVRKELGVVTDWKPTVITHKGKPLGVPEDLESVRNRESRSWWRRSSGR